MKFITEDDLRDLYKIQPFTDYDLAEGERLTPGARQFLLDRGVDLYDRNDPFAKLEREKGAKGTEEVSNPLGDKKKRILEAKINAMKAEFLLTTKEMLDIDACIAQQLTNLFRQLSGLASVSEGTIDTPDLCCKNCTGITLENFQDALGNCFDITEFHMSMPKGKQILMLSKLKSNLDVFSIEVEELIGDAELQQNFTGKINQIVNTLAQMICVAMGGNECQRTS